MPRLFAAARVRPCPAPLRDLIQGLRPLRRVKAVAPENVHFTLRFFGDTDTEAVPRLSEALRDQVASAAPPAFDLTLKGLSTFPAKGRPKVLWARPDETAATRLKALAELVENAAESVGLGTADRAFVPHLTIGRMRGGQPSGRGGRGEAAVERIVHENAATELGTVRIGAIHLVESTLRPEGPVYEDRVEVPLV